MLNIPTLNIWSICICQYTSVLNTACHPQQLVTQQRSYHSCHRQPHSTYINKIDWTGDAQKTENKNRELLVFSCVLLELLFEARIVPVGSKWACATKYKPVINEQLHHQNCKPLKSITNRHQNKRNMVRPPLHAHGSSHHALMSRVPRSCAMRHSCPAATYI